MTMMTEATPMTTPMSVRMVRSLVAPQGLQREFEGLSEVHGSAFGKQMTGTKTDDRLQITDDSYPERLDSGDDNFRWIFI
jgi:hypothetical protein